MPKVVQTMGGASAELASGVEWSPKNTMHFIGVVTDIIPPKVIVSKGRNHLIRMVIVEERSDKGKTVSSIALQLPDKFLMSKLEKMQYYKVEADFAYYTKAVRKADSCITVCNLVAVKPLLQHLYSDYNQVLHRRKTERKRPPRVDGRGYKYPYNY